MRAKDPPGQISDQEQPWRIRNFSTADIDGATLRMITPSTVPIASKKGKIEEAAKESTLCLQSRSSFVKIGLLHNRYDLLDR